MERTPIRLDASEGGGQTVRTALTLSLVTGTPVVLDRIRAGREPAGLRPSHLACVRAAQAISGARVQGAEEGGSRLEFEPAPVRPGRYLLDLGPCAPTPLALQTIALPLSLAGGSTSILLRGGTHLEGGPLYHYLATIWLPALERLGHRVELELNAAGFAPEGGGELRATVHPAAAPAALEARARGTLREVRVLSTVSNVPFSVAHRQGERVLSRLREHGIYAEAENLPLPAPRSKGSSCLVAATFERARVGFSAVGGAEEAPEAVADRAASAFVEFVSGRAALDPFLADQLVLPLAAAAAGLCGEQRPISRFSAPMTGHLARNAALAERFLDVEVAVLPRRGGEAGVRIAPRQAGLLETLRKGATRAEGSEPG